MGFTQQQIDYLSSLHFINNIDSHLRIISSVKLEQLIDIDEPRVILLLECHYDNAPVEKLSFDLHHYTYAEIIQLARNIRDNEFILQTVDNLLAGDIE